MKKNLTLLLFMLIGMVAIAGNPFKGFTGKENLKGIMETDGSAQLVFDWSEAKYDYTKDLKEGLKEDYDFVLSDCFGKYMDGFNSKSKHLKLSTSDNGVKYKFVLKITNIDKRFQPFGFVPKHEGLMWGKLEIVDIATQQVVSTVDIFKAMDGTDFVPKECFGATFYLLGNKTAKLK